MSQRDYNQVYMLGRLTLQVMQKGQNEGLVVHMTPGLTLAINNRDMVVALGLEWLVGTVNIGWAKAQFVKNEWSRREQVADLADKAGLTVKQQKLRWGW